MKEITRYNNILLSSVCTRKSIMKKKTTITGKDKEGHSTVHTAKLISLSLKEAVRAFQILTVNSTLPSHHIISKGQWCPQV